MTYRFMHLYSLHMISVILAKHSVLSTPSGPTCLKRTHPSFLFTISHLICSNGFDLENPILSILAYTALNPCLLMFRFSTILCFISINFRHHFTANNLREVSLRVFLTVNIYRFANISHNSVSFLIYVIIFLLMIEMDGTDNPYILAASTPVISSKPFNPYNL